MANHQILTATDHATLRIRTEAGEGFGDLVAAAYVVPSEFMALACEFPILFRYDATSGKFSALALLGFEEGENLFLENGRWDASLRPLSLSIGPFLVGKAASDDGPAQVHINMDHPRVSSDGEGVLLFDDAGQPTPYLEDIAARLGALDEGHRASGAFYAALDRYELLEPFAMDVTMPDGGTQRLVGYHLVSEEKLAALEPGPLAELHRSGVLRAAIAAQVSLGNLAKLVQRKASRSRG